MYGSPGQPWLPVQGVLVFAPKGVGLRVRAEPGRVVDNVLLGPIPRFPKRDGGRTKPDFTMDPRAYGVTSPRGARQAWLADRGIMAGIPVARLVIAPLTFVGQQRQVILYRKVEVILSYPPGLKTPEIPPPLNHAVRGLPLRSAGNARDRYLVIVADGLDAGLADWVDFRRNQGMDVDIVPVSEAGPEPERIKAFIRARYFSSQRPDMVLLVGDSELVPPLQGDRTCKFCPSDYEYSLLDGNDWYPDLAVGRWSAQSLGQVLDQANKALRYETMKTDTGFLHAAAVISSSQGEGKQNDDVTAQNTIDALRALGYNPVAAFLHSNNTDTVNAISDTINQGVGLLYYYGHGSGQAWVTTSPHFTIEDVDVLRNAFMRPFVMDVSCYSGQFTTDTGDCMAEAWIHGPGLAVFAATAETSWIEPTILAAGFTRGLGTDDPLLTGGLLLNARAWLIQQAGLTSDVKGTLQQYTLFGDPGQVLYTRPPGDLTVDFPAYVVRGTGQLHVTVALDGVPVQNAEVTLFNTQAALWSLSDAKGRADFDMANLKTGDYRLFVRAKNALPFYARIVVTPDTCPVVRAAQDYGCKGAVSIEVRDPHANQAQDKRETVYLTQGAARCKAMETGPDTGIFRAVCALPSGVTEGQTVQWTYHGPDTCGDASVRVKIDCRPPQCKDIAIQPLGDRYFGLLCTTDKPSQLTLGVTDNNGFSTRVREQRAGTHHHIVVNGLTPSTHYTYSLVATDMEGNTSEAMVGTLTTRPCRARCMDRACGPDGCGKSCGPCFSDQTCTSGECTGGAGCTVRATPTCDGCPCEKCTCRYDSLCCTEKWDQECVQLCRFACGGCGNGCVPSCTGKECGNDGCGGLCGTCPKGEVCREGTCVVVPWCGDGICGDNEDCATCEQDCGCGPGEVCTSLGVCCKKQCRGKECGADGCGGLCGTCTAGEVCRDGRCVTGPVCGDQRCTPPENCENCPRDCVCPYGTCKHGRCVCAPLCRGKECGADGCGGTCGTCAAGSVCRDGVCEAIEVADACTGTDLSGGEDTHSAHGGTCDTLPVWDPRPPWSMVLLMLLALSLFRKPGYPRGQAKGQGDKTNRSAYK